MLLGIIQHLSFRAQGICHVHQNILRQQRYIENDQYDRGRVEMHSSDGPQLPTDTETHGPNGLLHVERSSHETLFQSGIRELHRFDIIENLRFR